MTNLLNIRKERDYTAVMFNLKEKIVVEKKQNEEPAALKDPKTDSILLISREEKAEYKELVQIKERIHYLQMHEEYDDEPEFTE